MNNYLKLLLICLISLLWTGCNKPMENPESIDPIYQDLKRAAAAVQGEIGAEKKLLEEHVDALGKVQPQTGQIKYAEKRVTESRARLLRLDQEFEYYNLRADQRMFEARRDYLKSFHKGEVWPNPEEYSLYLSTRDAQAARGRSWSSRDRIKKLLPKKALVPRGTEESKH